MLYTFGLDLGTLWNHFFNMCFDLMFEPSFQVSWKPVLAKEREAHAMSGSRWRDTMMLPTNESVHPAHASRHSGKDMAQQGNPLLNQA